LRNVAAQRTWAEVSRSAIEHNLRFLRSQIPADCELMPAIKAQAYGHGAQFVARILSENGVRHAAVANLYEALEIADFFEPPNILLLSAPLAAELPEIVRHGFASIVSSELDVTALEKWAVRLQKQAYVHLKIDTGMGRLGCAPQEAPQICSRILQSRHLQLKGVMTHFASADVDLRATRKQLRLFLHTVEKLRLPCNFPLHAANSAGLLRLAPARLQLVRPGLTLYGVSPVKGFAALLRPALTWKSRITLLKNIPAGHGVSYASTFRAPRPMRIAVVSVGYADGYPRALSNKAHVLIRGQRCDVLGRVTMDEIMVAVDKVPGVERGEEVILLGAELPASELAKWANTSAYEILTRIGTRVERVPIR